MYHRLGRLSYLVSSAACTISLLASGCGSGVLGGALPGGGSSTSSSGQPVPAVPDAAWSVTLGGGSQCQFAVSTGTLGAVDTSVITDRVEDGVSGAVIECSVSGPSLFKVTASASQGADVLDIVVPSIQKNTTQASPAIGMVSYKSAATVVPYEGTSCEFHFEGSQEAVAAGEVWVSFSCAAVTNAAIGSTCPLTQGVAVFENCSTGP